MCDSAKGEAIMVVVAGAIDGGKPAPRLIGDEKERRCQRQPWASRGESVRRNKRKMVVTNEAWLAKSVLSLKKRAVHWAKESVETICHGA